jgi:hypothetical protein
LIYAGGLRLAPASFEPIAEDWTLVKGELNRVRLGSTLLERELEEIMPEGCALALASFDHIAENWTLVEGELNRVRGRKPK